MTEAETPDAYWGVWRRRVLEVPGRAPDLNSRVYWLQTRRWHGDIRVPAHRPDFSCVQSLEQCSRLQLEWLCRQQGFAGITQVDGDVCRWHRHIDFQLSEANDVGRMNFAGERLEEFGVEADYHELWERLPESRGVARVLCSHDGDAAGTNRQRFVLIAGEYFMQFTNRGLEAEQARLVRERIMQGCAGDEELLAYADFEISFGRRIEEAWRIELSTHPWLEGTIGFSAAGETPRQGWEVVESANAADNGLSATPGG